MKLWQKDYEIQKLVEEFTIGKDPQLDLELARFDILGSLAHTQMLTQVGLISHKNGNKLKEELKKIYREIQSGVYQIDPGVEDIHSQVELTLTDRLGEVGKMIHTARSRNDQVLLDIRLFLRHEIQQIVVLVEDLFDQLLSLSQQHQEVPLPGYTHLQVAMPSSFGLWFAAYAESLVDDLQLLQATYKVINKNPLGSAAGYGSSLPINRQLTTDLLGFESLNYNVVYAQFGRGKSEWMVSSALSSIAGTLNKLASDICLFMSQNFNFVSFPDDLTTGSSIMPHKKNPDIFELIRGKSNKIKALPNEISLVTSNLSSGYFRDLQILKENFLPSIQTLKECLRIASYALKQISVNQNILDNPIYQHLYSVEVVNQEVIKGVPFREAYQKVAKLIEEGKLPQKPKVSYTHEGSLGNLCNDQIGNAMVVVIKGFDFEKPGKALAQLLK
ncbi:MAG: argininosuccinate lyase [Bacteroidetes bacterium]|nr:argininosuccinate lyase [Bacteroidota bacterium]